MALAIADACGIYPTAETYDAHRPLRSRRVTGKNETRVAQALGSNRHQFHRIKNGAVCDFVRVGCNVGSGQIFLSQLMGEEPLVITESVQGFDHIKVMLIDAPKRGGAELEHVRFSEFLIEGRDQAGKNIRCRCGADPRAVAIGSLGIGSGDNHRCLFTAVEDIGDGVIKGNHAGGGSGVGRSKVDFGALLEELVVRTISETAGKILHHIVMRHFRKLAGVSNSYVDRLDLPEIYTVGEGVSHQLFELSRARLPNRAARTFLIPNAP